MNLSPRDRRAVRLGAIALAAIFLVWLVVRPWIDSWAGARSRIAANRTALTDLQGQVRRVLGQRKRLVGAYGSAVGKGLPDAESAPVKLLQAVQGVLGKGGFKLTDYQPQPARAVRQGRDDAIKDVLIVPLQVRGKCKLAQLAKCLDGMRTAPTLVLVDRVVVNNNEKKPGQLDVTLLLATLAEAKGGGA